jgi:RNA polymerase primary sigma factor
MTATLTTFIRDIDATPLLNQDNERMLAERVIQGDQTARDHLIRANLRLVVKLARQYTGRGVSLDDLIQEGTLGLVHAVEYFDPSLNYRFSTYAKYWIMQSILRLLKGSTRAIRIPTYAAELVRKWRKVTAELHDELGAPPSDEAVAERLELTAKQLKIIKKALRIYHGPGAETDEQLLSESVVDERAPAPLADAVQADDLHAVLTLVEGMTPREATILRLRFGLDGDEPLNLSQIGVRLNLTRERVRQLERDALRNLREALAG